MSAQSMKLSIIVVSVVMVFLSFPVVRTSSAAGKPLVIEVFRGKTKITVQPPSGVNAEGMFQQEVLCRQRAEFMVKQRASEYAATNMGRMSQSMADFEFGVEMLYCLEHLGYKADQP